MNILCCNFSSQMVYHVVKSVTKLLKTSFEIKVSLEIKWPTGVCNCYFYLVFTREVYYHGYCLPRFHKAAHNGHLKVFPESKSYNVAQVLYWKTILNF